MMSTNNMVHVLCRFGGHLFEESNLIYYKHGTNRIIQVDRLIDYLNLLARVRETSKLTHIGSIKYKYPGLGLDSLVSIENDDDVTNMIQAFPQGSDEPIQLFVFHDTHNHSILNALPSHVIQGVDNGNIQAPSRDLHGSNEASTPLQHDTDANKDFPCASNVLGKIVDSLAATDNQELPCQVPDSCVNDIPIMIGINLKEGQEFKDKDSFHKALREYAIHSKFEYKRTRSGCGHFHAKCIGSTNCSWRIHAFKLSDKPVFKIKSLKGNHNCSAAKEQAISEGKTKHRLANRKWIADLIKDRLQKKNLHITPKDIVDEIRREYGIEVSYEKAWRGKELALEKIHFERSVSALAVLCKEIERTNPGSRAIFNRPQQDNTWRLFVAYKAAFRCFQLACRPIVMLDCVEVGGRHPYHILFAMARDVKNNDLPIAFGIVNSKKGGSWEWFCKVLAEILDGTHNNKLVIFTDRREGIREIVSDIFPHSLRNLYSLGRLMVEFSMKFRCWRLTELFEAAIYTRSSFNFDVYMSKIREKSLDAWNFVNNIDFAPWAAFQFQQRSDVDFIDPPVEFWKTNLSEWWGEDRGGDRLPNILSFLEHFHVHMMDLFNERLRESSTWRSRLVAEAEWGITLDRFSGRISVSGNKARGEFKVFDPENVYEYNVDLVQRTCSCSLRWNILGVPCRHAIAAIKHSGYNKYDYCDERVTVTNYLEAYSDVIRPLTTPNDHICRLQLCQTPSEPTKRRYVRKKMKTKKRIITPMPKENVLNEGKSLISRPLDQSLLERMLQALSLFKESAGGGILAQVWVPIRHGDEYVLSTCEQPYLLDQVLAGYREVSRAYTFAAKEMRGYSLGLPGRVFISKMPEWTSNVKYYSKTEYLRLNHALSHEVRGSLAVPIFYLHDQSCCAVLELVTTKEKPNFDQEMESVCRAIGAVDLRTTKVRAHQKSFSKSQRTALAEIVHVLRVVCHAHRLPVALTWIPCYNFDGISGECIRSSTGDSDTSQCQKALLCTQETLCYVNDSDTQMHDFVHVCGEHHLEKGQGIAGKALQSNHPFFAPDVKAYDIRDYPLAHHARKFGLNAAIAIQLRSTYTGNDDYILEFFLPVSCKGSSEQQLLLDDLSSTMQRIYRSLRIVTNEELSVSKGPKAHNQSEVVENEVLASFPSTDMCGTNSQPILLDNDLDSTEKATS